MAWRRERRSASIEEFYAEENRAGLSQEEFSKRVYVKVHSLYLKVEGKMKPEFGRWWRNLTGVYMEDSFFEYMHDNEPVLTVEKIAADVWAKKEITSMKFLVKTVVALEFDLWIIERYNNGKELDLILFQNYLAEKYGTYCDRQFSNFKKFDLYAISSFEEMAKELSSCHDKIKEFYDALLEGNKRKINIDHADASRIKDYQNNAEPKETEHDTVPADHKERAKSEDRTPSNHGLDHENQFVLQQLEERIEKLERDIREFKRQRDDAREYSVNQYDKGVKDLFNAMNDIRYGKVLDYFFSLLSREDLDENLASYLENLFMIFEDMEIEPIAEYDSVPTNEANLTKDYNLDFEKNEYDKEQVKIKYVGWKYKDMILEKPTLELKK